MVIKTFDPESLSEKATVTKNSSIIWNERFYDIGSFEIHTTQSTFQENDIVAYKYNGKVKAGIILKIVEGFEDYIISGYDLKGIFNFRYITNFSSSANAEKNIENLLIHALKTDDRNIPLLITNCLASDATAEVYTPENAYLGELLKSYGVKNEIGITIDFDFRNIILTTKRGSDKTKNVIFSRRLKNIENAQRTRDSFNAYNVCYYKNDEVIKVFGAQKGILRKECYSDKNPEEYLSQKASTDVIKASGTEKYICGIDYELGDYVTVEAFGHTTTKQITEIKYVHEANQNKTIPIFGTEKENPLKKIMKGM